MSYELPTPTAPLAGMTLAPFSAGRPAAAAQALNAHCTQRRRGVDAAPSLITLPAVQDRLTEIANRIDRLRADYYVANDVPELTQPQLDHMRAVGLAMLIHLLDQTQPGQGARVARALFPDDVWTPPADGDDDDIHNAITRPAELGPCL